MATTHFQDLYNNQLSKQLQEHFKYKSVAEIPKLGKITINMGVGQAVSDSKAIEHAVNELTLISGQKPVVTLARKSIAGFKLREGMAIGCKVTLRRQRMYEFLERFVYIALPRVRDFRGLTNKGFDKMGNYSMGLKEQIVFPEINYDKIDKIRGLDINFTTTSKTDEEAKMLLQGFKMPFIK